MDIVKEASNIIDRFESSKRRASDVLSEFLPEELFCVSSAIDTCCDLTTRSALRLLADGIIWDSVILFRTVLNATAKFCYLLGSDDATERDKRLKEYVAEATIKEYGSVYPQLHGMLNQGLFGNGEQKDFVVREILNPISEKKLNDNTPKEQKDAVCLAQNHLQYLDMSHLLANEFEFWKSLAAVFDFEYATANSFVHVNYVGACEIMHWLGLPEETRRVKAAAYRAHLLFMLCALHKVRNEMMFKRAGVDPTAMRHIMTIDSPFVKMVDKLCSAETGRITNATEGT